MDKFEVEILHNEITAALRPILAKHGLELLPSTLTHDSNGFRKPIKAIRRVLAQRPPSSPVAGFQAGAFDESRMKSGHAGPGPAFVKDNRAGGRIRPVMITEAKRTKYAFYFTDVPEVRHMLGHFQLFTTEAP